MIWFGILVIDLGYTLGVRIGTCVFWAVVFVRTCVCTYVCM